MKDKMNKYTVLKFLFVCLFHTLNIVGEIISPLSPSSNFPHTKGFFFFPFLYGYGQLKTNEISL